MDKNAIWKWLILIVATAASIALIYPPVDQYNAAGELVRAGKIKLGLDLRGGTSYVLEVDTSELAPDAVRDAQARALEVIRNRVDQMGVSEPIIYPEPKNNRIVVQIPGLKAEDRERAIKNIQSAAFLQFRMVHPKNEELVDDLLEENIVPPGYKMVSIDEQAPNGQWRANKYYKKEKMAGGQLDMGAADGLAKLRAFHAPAGYDFMLSKEVREGQDLFRPYFVSKRNELTGESIKNAGVDYQQFGQPIVTLRFDAKGSKRFGVLTSDYAPGGAKNPSPDGRRYLAIVLDGTLYSAPFIKTEILGGQAVIEGSFSVKEAQDLSIVLRAGSLPAPVKVIEERSVDPTLGRDSVRSGGRAALYGALAVVLFMLLYYRVAGLVANMALFLDAVLLPLGMIVVSGFLSLLTSGSGWGGGGASLPTLTLPGIAGIVLTMGMAVDANVLIFERIREELAAGKRLGSAITAGYEKAFSTIFDANITTLLTAVILFWQGSGPVRGFAVTLGAGIVVSMYTALVFTRLVFNWMAEKTSLTTLSMGSIIKNPSFDFLGKRVIAVTLSMLVIVGTMAMFAKNGLANFGVDFVGGRSLTISFEQKQSVESIRDALKKAGIEATIQHQKDLSVELDQEAKDYLEVKVAFDQGESAKTVLTTDFASAGFTVIKEDSVGPQVGKELQKQALLAILFALIGMVIYISFRFEFAFAVGAIVAIMHDVVITVGIYCLFGRQLSLPIVAALLTIVGYSVNDTIVIFDRIREDLKLLRGRPYADIANLSINQTLSRTLLTSFTTLLTVAVLLLLGGGAINDFALTLFIGITVGTYSSIYIATPVMLLWHRGQKS